MPFQVRKVLLTTGLTDDLPRVEGIDGLYGRSVHHCPYCDGFEHRDQTIAVYGEGDKGAGLALMMKQWSSDVMFIYGWALTSFFRYACPTRSLENWGLH